MITISKAIRSLQQTDAHLLCRCIKIERTDGVVWRFTDHDYSLVVLGETYVPAGSIDSSATEKRSGVQERSAEYKGAISDSRISVDDLRAGRYDGAKITQMVVNWKYPFRGPYESNIFWVDSLRHTGEEWAATVEGLTGFLRAEVGRIYKRTCDAVVGDTRCGVNLTGYTATSTVQSVSVDRLSFIANVLTGPSAETITVNNYFRFGKLTWTSGNNSGVVCDVKSDILVTRRFDLQLKTPVSIQVGDAFTVSKGCDGRYETCGAFGNKVRFRGFPTVPGVTKTLLGPDHK